MTSQPGWKKQQIKKKWQSLLSIVITVFLLFAIVNGLARGFSLKNQIGESRWDGKSALAIAANSTNPSLFIFQPDPEKIAVLTLDGETFYETGDFDNPLVKLSDKIDKSADQLTKSLIHTYGVKIDNYITFSEKVTVDEKFARSLFVNFASIATPFKLLTIGWTEEIADTNITRIDAFKLWWQVKSLGAEELILADLSSSKESIINADGQKVLGADTATLNREISSYLENLDVVSDNVNIKIVNGSGLASAGRLAASFVESVGGNVIDLTNQDSRLSKTQIITTDKNLYTTRYLANIFECDIKEAPKISDEGEITVTLGSDFVSTYFE